jgi:ferric enterobactin receptor
VKHLLALLACFLLLSTAYAQDIENVKVPQMKMYKGTLHDALNKFTKEYNLRFDYDSAAFQGIEFQWVFATTSFSAEWKEIVKQYKLKYEVDSAKVIRVYLVEQLRNATVVTETKTYTGSSEKMNITVTGKVFDEKSGETLPFVVIRVPGTNVGTQTNVDGFFTLLNVPSDTSTIILTYIGYQTRTVYLNPKIIIDGIQVGMVKQSRELDEVMVIADKQDLLQSAEKPGMIKMSTAKLDMLPNLGEKDIFRSFQLMPGVSAANESSAGLYVRGSTPDQSLVLYDGFTVYHVDHLFGFYSAFNADAIKDVQLYRGGFESKFGGRLGSVVEITGKDGSSKKWNLGASVSLLGINGFLEIPIKNKFTSLIAFRTSYQGYMYNLLYSKFDNQNNTSTPTNQNGPPGGGPGGFSEQNTKPKSNFYDLSAKLAYKFGKNDVNNLSFSLFNSRDKLDNSRSNNIGGFGGSGRSFSSSVTDLTNYGNLGGSLKYSRKFSEKLYSNTLISASNYHSNRDRSNSMTLQDSAGNETTRKFGTLENNNLLDLAFKTDWEVKLAKWNRLETGLLANYYHIKYSYAQNDTAPLLSRNDKGATASVYVQDNFNFWKNRVNILIGTRFTYFTRTNKPYFEPRASADILLVKGLKFQAAWGLYYQYANRVTREDILQGSRDFWILSDGKKVPVSSSMHYIAGLQYEYKWLTISAEGYYKNLWNITEYSLRLKPAIGNISYSESFYTGNGVAKGVDFNIMGKIKGYNGWATYTLGKVTYDLAAFGGKYPATHDVRHEFKTVHTYRIWRFDISATWVFSTGKPYTAPEGGYQLTLLDGTTQDYISVSQKNGKRFPNYHRMDFAVTYNQPLPSTGGNIALSFSLFNLYNRKNVWYKEFQVEDGQVVETNVNYLGITPNVTLNFRIR